MFLNHFKKLSSCKVASSTHLLIEEYPQHTMENLPVNVEDRPYQYTRLASQDSFRLIEILPGLIHDQHISCIISEYSLARAVNVPRAQYRALSYLWGDPAPSRTIYLRDETIADWYRYDIHLNLWLFLAHMWRKKQFECLLWTDRICLNQDDEQEKAQQIPRMGLIYSQAEFVIIWLGLSAWEEKYFQEHMEWIKNVGNLNSMMLSRRPPQHCLAICSVQEHEYWKRMWITQEVAMAQKVVVEMQETPSFNLQELFQAMFGFASRNSGVYWRMMNLIDMRGLEGTTPLEPESSWKLVADHCQRRCTHSHDHIYGLLGMVKENDPILQIAIDYNKPASDVLFDALFTATNPSLARKNLKVVEALMDIGLLEDINSLEEYGNRDHSWKLTENKVVKTFSRIALGVFDALNLIMETCDGLLLSSDDITIILINMRLEALAVDEFQWKAIIGIMLTLGQGDASQRRHEQWKRTREQWKKVRWPKFKTQSESLWLCSKHASHLAPEQLHLEKNITLNRLDLRPNDVVKTCRHYRQHGSLCEGSKMSLEVPDSGTRLELDYVAPTEREFNIDHGRKQVDFTIWFENGASRNT